MGQACAARALAVEAVPVLTMFNPDQETACSDASHPQPERDLKLRQRFLECAQWFLHNGAASHEPWLAARSFLAARGLDPARCGDLPIGFFPHPALMRAGLIKAGFTPEEIKASGLLSDSRVTQRLVGPIRDPQQRIVSFWARHCQEPTAGCLYLRRDWRRQTPLAYLDIALPALTEALPELVIVEDFLDAVWLHVRGLAQCAAVGGSLRWLTEDRWEHLASLGVRRAVLVIDDRGSRHHATLAALEAARKARTSPEVSVLTCPHVAGIGTLPQWIDSIGMDAFLALLRPKRANTANAQPATPSGFCAFHRCDRMECFCWD